MTIKPGKLSPQRVKVLATDCDDTSIAGIIVKAEIGFNKLIPILSSFINPNSEDRRITLSVESLYIITNKKAEDSFATHWENEHSEDEVHTVTPTRKIENGLITFDKFPCVLIAGTDWLQEVIPERPLL